MALDEPIIAPSAYKHGLVQDDILHAYRNPIRVWDLGDGFTMMVIPTRPRSSWRLDTWRATWQS